MKTIACKRKLPLICVLFLFFTLSTRATIIKVNPTITIKTADHQTLEGNKFIASGNVEISWDQYFLYSDYLEFNLETKELIARGRVTMTSQKTVISGEQFKFNLIEKSGELVETYGQLSPTTRYATSRLAVEDNETMSFNKLDFTSCAQCVPRWKITCSKGKIKKEKYIEMKDIVFKVKNIPVFYFPYMRYPLPKNGRATGFLFPIMGTSPNFGFFIKNALYWNIKPNIDMTIGLDYYGKSGIGNADEIRYLFNKISGNIVFYLFKYKSDFQLQDTVTTTTTGITQTSNGWKPERKFDFFLKMQHIQDISFLKTRVTLDIDQQSDPNFVRYFSDDFETVQNLTHRSSVAINTSLSNVRIAATASDNESFIPAKNKSSITRYLPSVVLNVNQQKIGPLPGYFSLSATYVTKTTREKIYGDPLVPPGENETTNPFLDIPLTQLILKPSYTLPLIKAPWLNANLTLKSNHAFYPNTRDPEAKTLTVLDDSLSVDYQTADLTLKGPVFSRIYEFKSSKIKHVIEPQMTFKYATDPVEEDRKRIVQRDSFYYQESSTLGLALTMRLLYKSRIGKASAREIFSYSIKQDYYLDAELANRNRLVDGVSPEFSNLSNILRLRPVPDFILDATVNYNHYIKHFNQIVFSLNYQKAHSVIGGSLRYTRTLNQYLYSTEESTDETTNEEETVKLTPLEKALVGETIGGTVNFNMNSFPLKLSTRLDYNLKTKEFAYCNLAVNFDYQCINFIFKVSGIKVDERMIPRFRFGISLGNLGTVRDFLGVRQ